MFYGCQCQYHCHCHCCMAVVIQPHFIWVPGCHRFRLPWQPMPVQTRSPLARQRARFWAAWPSARMAAHLNGSPSAMACRRYLSTVAASWFARTSGGVGPQPSEATLCIAGAR